MALGASHWLIARIILAEAFLISLIAWLGATLFSARHGSLRHSPALAPGAHLSWRTVPGSVRMHARFAKQIEVSVLAEHPAKGERADPAETSTARSQDLRSPSSAR